MGNIRFVVSFIDKDGLRAMVGPVQGRNTHETRQEAETYLGHFLANNPERRLVEVFGPKSLGTFEVSAIECWPGHHDPKGCYISKDLNPDQDVPEPF